MGATQNGTLHYRCTPLIVARHFGCSSALRRALDDTTRPWPYFYTSVCPRGGGGPAVVFIATSHLSVRAVCGPFPLGCSAASTRTPNHRLLETQPCKQDTSGPCPSSFPSGSEPITADCLAAVSRDPHAQCHFIAAVQIQSMTAPPQPPTPGPYTQPQTRAPQNCVQTAHTHAEGAARAWTQDARACPYVGPHAYAGRA